MGKPEERKAKDRDFTRTVKGMLFCAVGYLHPPDKYTAYLKYIPAPQGRWHKDQGRYDRILTRYNLSSVRDTVGYLEENYPHYNSLLSSPRDEVLHGPPRAGGRILSS